MKVNVSVHLYILPVLELTQCLSLATTSKQPFMTST